MLEANIDIVAVVLVIVGAALVGLAFHPFTTYPLSLKWFVRNRPVSIQSPDAEWRPSVAICMSAYNESALIESKMRSLIAMAEAYGRATIHVYADAPSDGTDILLQQFADRVDLVSSRTREGKTFGMNTLVARSSSDLILFTDANVLHDDAVLTQLIAPFRDPAVGCTSAHLVYSNGDESATSATGAIYWSIEERIKQIESATVGMIGVDGAMFMMRRTLHEPPPPQLIDDLFLSLTVLIKGAQLVSVPEALVFERSAVGSTEEFDRKKRIACQAMNVHAELWPKLRRMPFLRLYAYFSHRLVKWITPFLLLGGAICLLLAVALIVGPFAASAIVLVVAAATWLGERYAVKPFSMLSTAMLSLAGVATGLVQSWFTNRTYTVWNPALSVRDDALPNSEA